MKQLGRGDFMDKKWNTLCDGKIIKHGAVGYRIGQVGSPKWKSYCIRSGGIAKKYPSARSPCSRNSLSRKKWRCGGLGL
jgi:hypothetical protein